MQTFIALVFSTLLASTAFANTFMPASSMICTRDYNAWGRASTCQCPSETYYDHRVGACLQGDLGFTTIEGRVAPQINRAGIVIGYTLTTDADEVFLIVAPVAVRTQFDSNDFQAKKFKFSGELIEKSEDAINRPAILILDNLEDAEDL